MQLLRRYFPVLLSTLSFPLLAETTDVSVIERYPACEFEVLDTIDVTNIVNYKKISTNPSEFSKEVALLITDLKHTAGAAGANKVAIVDKSVRRTRNLNARLTLTAEIIGDCLTPEDGLGAATPYNAIGVRQSSMGVSTISFGGPITIDLSRKTVAEPELGNNTSITLNEGVYGLALGATVQQMLDKFGTPTFELALSDDSQLFAYGRDHWFTFKNDSLVKASSESDRFTATFINYLPFDERFENRIWHVTNKLHKSATLSPDKSASQQSQFVNENAILTVKTEEYSGRDRELEIKVTGFELTKKGITLPDTLPVAATENDILNYFSHQLTEDNGSIAFKDVPHNDIGRTRKTRDGQLHLFNAFTLAEVNGNTFSEIQISPDFVTAIEPKKEDWRFGKFYYGQSEEEALTAAGDTAFYFDHVLEYEGGNYTAKVFLEREGDEYRVHSMEINVF